MLVWVDDRTPVFSFSIPSAFTMLLEPGGPAARAVPETPGPVLVEEQLRSKDALKAPRRLSIMGTREGVLHVSFGDKTPATLELFDVSGRSVLSRELSSRGTAGLEVRVGEAATLPSGVYLARVTQGSSIAKARIAILH
jgi:hypothetical protein